MPHFTALRGLKATKFKTPKLPPKVKAKMDQSVGKLRRFALTTVSEEYIAKMQALRKDGREKIAALLTPEQKAKFAEMRDNKRGPGPGPDAK